MTGHRTVAPTRSAADDARVLLLDGHALLCHDRTCRFLGAGPLPRVAALLSSIGARAFRLAQPLGPRGRAALAAVADDDDVALGRQLRDADRSLAVEVYEADQAAGCAAFSWADHFAGLARRGALVLTGHQPAYHPYLPYLARIQQAEVFSVADDMALRRNLFQHRQRLHVGPVPDRWLTVPVRRASGPSDEPLAARRIAEPAGRWRSQHWAALAGACRALPFFEQHAAFLEQAYRREWHSLTALNTALTMYVAVSIGISPGVIVTASTLPLDTRLRKGARIAHELALIGGRPAPSARYLCGTAASYLLEPDGSGRRHIDHILDLSIEVLMCSVDGALVRRESGLPPAAPGIVVLSAIGGDTLAELLRSATRLVPLIPS